MSQTLGTGQEALLLCLRNLESIRELRWGEGKQADESRQIHGAARALRCVPGGTLGAVAAAPFCPRAPAPALQLLSCCVPCVEAEVWGVSWGQH